MASNAVTLNGSSQYAKVLNYAALDSLTNFTIEGWFKQHATGGNTYAKAFHLANATDEMARLTTENASPSSGTNFSVDYSGTNADGYKSSSVFDTGTWVHVALVSTAAGKTKIIKNGVEISYDLQQTPTGSQTSHTDDDLYIGVSNVLDKHFKGDFACFRLWNVSRTAAEIAANMNYYLDPTKETGLVLNCNVDEESGTTIDNDVSGGNDASLTGSPSWTTGPTLAAKSYPTDPGASWYNASWTKRKWVGVMPATGAGTGYQMKLTVHYGSGTDTATDVYCGSNCKTDFGDIRFTDDDGTTLLDYWVESKTDSDNAVVWIEIADDISSTITEMYMYYGNSGATTASSGTNTFPLLFDDFGDASLDTGIWTARDNGTGAAQTESGGTMTLNPNDSTISSAGLETVATFTNGIALMVNRKFENGTEHYMDVSLGSGSIADEDGNTSNWWHAVKKSGYYWFYQSSGDVNDGIYEMPASGAKAGLRTGASDAYSTSYQIHQYGYGPNGELVWIQNGSHLYVTVTDTTFQSSSKTFLFHQGEHTGGNGSDTVLDWAVVRKFVLVEPVFQTWGSEETYSAATLRRYSLTTLGVG